MPPRLFTAISTLTALPSMNPKYSDTTIELTSQSGASASDTSTVDFSSLLRDAKFDEENAEAGAISEERFSYMRPAQSSTSTPHPQRFDSSLQYSGYLDAGTIFELFDKRQQIEFRWGSPNRVLTGSFPGVFLVTTVTWDEEQQVVFSSVTLQTLQHITDAATSIPIPLMRDSDAKDVISVDLGQWQRNAIHLIALLTSYEADDGSSGMHLCKQVHINGT
eukprot:gb/GECG01016150.1/.p1 GENE.gb/GECG01016150.1/~~gb/GECG01016150.1/.p1  ORF type:complete len:220 (+),score=31.21 gb/GECG01016150.1/:1-660(+)